MPRSTSPALATAADAEEPADGDPDGAAHARRAFKDPLTLEEGYVLCNVPEAVVTDEAGAVLAYKFQLQAGFVKAYWRSFVEDKRGALLDLLLDSPGRTSHFSNFWFDLLRVKSRQRNLSASQMKHGG